MEFPCCNAAMSIAFILKNASPLLFSQLMTHTPAHPAEISSHAPKRGRVVLWCHMCSATCSVYTEPVLFSIPVLSISLEMPYLFIYFARPWLNYAFIQANGSAISKHRLQESISTHASYFVKCIWGHYFSSFSSKACTKWELERLWKGAICRTFSSPGLLPSSEHAHIVWHLQLCWNSLCPCCSAVGLLPSGPSFRGYRKESKRD